MNLPASTWHITYIALEFIVCRHMLTILFYFLAFHVYH